MGAVRDRLARRPLLNSAAADGAVSLVLLLLMLLSLVTAPIKVGQHPNNVAAYLLAVGTIVPYLFHRRAPFVALAVCLSCLLTYAAIGYAAFPGTSAFVLLFGISLHRERSRSATAFVATAAVLVTATVLQPSGVVDRASAVSIALATVVAWLGGDNLRQRRARWAGLRERNILLEREREERARQAVVEERLRIARELHDVVAHAMCVIAVQSGVGSHVGREHPVEAQRALAAIETTSRSAMTELRQLLGVLRSDDDAAQTVPAPSLRDVPSLIRHVADGGLTAGLEIRGAPREVPPGVGRSVYRIIQEALTNAIKHGGPCAQVTVSYTDHDVTIEVTSDGSVNHPFGRQSVTPGHGIIGMRERIAVFGGDFSAAPRPGGGFRVAARLPFETSQP
jgi:signal transduction histidine kinase